MEYAIIALAIVSIAMGLIYWDQVKENRTRQDKAELDNQLVRNEFKEIRDEDFDRRQAFANGMHKAFDSIVDRLDAQTKVMQQKEITIGVLAKEIGSATSATLDLKKRIDVNILEHEAHAQTMEKRISEILENAKDNKEAAEDLLEVFQVSYSVITSQIDTAKVEIKEHSNELVEGLKSRIEELREQAKAEEEKEPAQEQ